MSRRRNDRECISCGRLFLSYDTRQDLCQDCDPDLRIRNLEDPDAPGVLEELIAENPYGDEELRRWVREQPNKPDEEDD